MKKFLSNLFFAFYKAGKPVLGAGGCRYYPSCSDYSKEAFSRFSFPKALFLSVKRISKCHPFSSGGFDPLPEK